MAGIISCLAFSPGSEGLLAAGSYNKTTALYSEHNAELLFVLHGQEGGVTQVRYLHDDHLSSFAFLVHMACDNVSLPSMIYSLCVCKVIDVI